MTTMGDLTEHFNAREFDVNEPFPSRYASLRYALAVMLEDFRALLGAPCVITSAYRSPSRNEQVGGAGSSEHMDGRAVDARFGDARDVRIITALLRAQSSGTLPACGQVIVYADTSHVHVSLPRQDGRPNKQLLYAYRDGAGMRRYRPLNNTVLVMLGGARVESEGDRAGKARASRHSA